MALVPLAMLLANNLWSVATSAASFGGRRGPRSALQVGGCAARVKGGAKPGPLRQALPCRGCRHRPACLHAGHCQATAAWLWAPGRDLCSKASAAAGQLGTEHGASTGSGSAEGSSSVDEAQAAGSADVAEASGTLGSQQQLRGGRRRRQQLFSHRGPAAGGEGGLLEALHGAHRLGGADVAEARGGSTGASAWPEPAQQRRRRWPPAVDLHWAQRPLQVQGGPQHPGEPDAYGSARAGLAGPQLESRSRQQGQPPVFEVSPAVPAPAAAADDDAQKVAAWPALHVGDDGSEAPPTPLQLPGGHAAVVPQGSASPVPGPLDWDALISQRIGELQTLRDAELLLVEDGSRFRAHHAAQLLARLPSLDLDASNSGHRTRELVRWVPAYLPCPSRALKWGLHAWRGGPRGRSVGGGEGGGRRLGSGVAIAQGAATRRAASVGTLPSGPSAMAP